MKALRLNSVSSGPVVGSHEDDDDDLTMNTRNVFDMENIYTFYNANKCRKDIQRTVSIELWQI